MSSIYREGMTPIEYLREYAKHVGYPEFEQDNKRSSAMEGLRYATRRYASEHAGEGWGVEEVAKQGYDMNRHGLFYDVIYLVSEPGSTSWVSVPSVYFSDAVGDAENAGFYWDEKDIEWMRSAVCVTYIPGDGPAFVHSEDEEEALPL